ncbi:MAG: hypothetical protein IT435_06210 [Phycisphaerales bacterium]|nr:hypothetical protein [Phycisphaerales bacterium]
MLDYRSVFTGDTHLGSRGTRGGELSAFLKHVRCQRLYLVGDIIDLWALKQRWRWPVMHNQVVRRILKHVQYGAHVVYDQPDDGPRHAHRAGGSRGCAPAGAGCRVHGSRRR